MLVVHEGLCHLLALSFVAYQERNVLQSVTLILKGFYHRRQLLLHVFLPVRIFLFPRQLVFLQQLDAHVPVPVSLVGRRQRLPHPGVSRPNDLNAAQQELPHAFVGYLRFVYLLGQALV